MKFFVMLGYEDEGAAIKAAHHIITEEQGFAAPESVAVGIGEKFGLTQDITEAEMIKSQKDPNLVGDIAIRESHNIAANLGVAIGKTKLMTQQITNNSKDRSLVIRRTVCVFAPFEPPEKKVLDAN